MTNRTIEFFETQFRQAGRATEQLSAFQEAALPHVTGRVLDLACGLGTFSLAAARRGCEVVAVDSSPTAIAQLSAAASAERLPVAAVRADLEAYDIPPGKFDSVVAIGILMFFPREIAHALLARIREAVRPGGCAAVTVLVEGTTFMRPFDPDRHYLFAPGEIARELDGWEVLARQAGESPAPGDSVRRFETIVARKPAAARE